MKNKNELKIGCQKLIKRSDGTIGIVDSDGFLYSISEENVEAIKSFLSTPYQEEKEVYVIPGQKLKKISGVCSGELFLVSLLGDNKVVLISLSTGSRYTEQKTVKDAGSIRLREIIGISDISEWEVIK